MYVPARVYILRVYYEYTRIRARAHDDVHITTYVCNIYVYIMYTTCVHVAYMWRYTHITCVHVSAYVCMLLCTCVHITTYMYVLIYTLMTTHMGDILWYDVM